MQYKSTTYLKKHIYIFLLQYISMHVRILCFVLHVGQFYFYERYEDNLDHRGTRNMLRSEQRDRQAAGEGDRQAAKRSWWTWVIFGIIIRYIICLLHKWQQQVQSGCCTQETASASSPRLPRLVVFIRSRHWSRPPSPLPDAGIDSASHTTSCLPSSEWRMGVSEE